jgi:hypothetical protein
LGSALSAASSGQTARQPTAQEAVPVDEVTVTALKQIDRATLIHVVVPKFVESHGVASERIDQLGRWRDAVCPETIGLRASYDEFVSRRVLDLARRVGAPVKRAGKCQANIAIIFSAKPQEQVETIARDDAALLGYARQQRDLIHLTHVVQAWYVTGTRSFRTVRSPLPGADKDSSASPTWNAAPPALTGGLQIDSQWSALHGQAGSRLGDSERSEFGHVTVIVDANAVRRFPLQAVADYIAMLALTRAGLDGCNALPSIIDLLSADCGSRAKPGSITEADVAYLKALYASNLELKLNFELGEVQQRMAQSIEALDVH